MLKPEFLSTFETHHTKNDKTHENAALVEMFTAS